MRQRPFTLEKSTVRMSAYTSDSYPNYEIWPNKRVVTSFEADYIRIYIDGNERDWSAFRKSVYYKIQQFVRNAYTFDD